MLVGKHFHTVDGKGRVFVPAKFRPDLQGELTLVKDLDRCLALYNEEQWNHFVQKLEAYGQIKMKRINRFFMSNTVNVTIDSQGRILIPTEFLEYADIEKDVAFVGMNRYAEIWNPEKFDAYNKESDAAEMEDILRSVGF